MGARYKCICGVYLPTKLTLCSKCAAKYGDNFKSLPLWVRLEYDRLNFGGDYDNDLALVRAEPIGKKGADVKGVEDPTYWERGRKQCPICHKPIKVNERLCKDHLTEYGGDPDKWPPWLQSLVKDDQRIIDAARNNREGSINDETFINGQGITRAARAGAKTAGSYGGRTFARHNQDDISTDTVNWGDNELDNPGSTSPALGEIKGDRSGYKYNAMAWAGDNGQFRGLGGASERDIIEDKIAAEQELKLWNPVAAAVMLLHHNGHTQGEIAELMKIRQQQVSEIIRKSVKRG